MPHFLASQAVKAFIFDCDGTLVESEEAHLLSWQKAAKEFGCSLPYEDYLIFVGKSDAAVAEFVSEKIDVSPAKLYERKREIFFEYQNDGLPPISATIAFLHLLIASKDKLGLKLAVASAAGKREILRNLQSLKVDNAFDVVLSGQEDLDEYNDPEGVNKPKPYIYLHAAKLLGVNPSECIAIEDSHTGVAAGTSAGCFTIAIPNYHSQNHDFSAAHLIIDKLSDFSVEDLLKMVKSRVPI